MYNWIRGDAAAVVLPTEMECEHRVHREHLVLLNSTVSYFATTSYMPTPRASCPALSVHIMSCTRHATPPRAPPPSVLAAGQQVVLHGERGEYFQVLVTIEQSQELRAGARPSTSLGNSTK
jgi:hypothetical protein